MPSTLAGILVLVVSSTVGQRGAQQDEIDRLKRSNASLTAALARSESSVASLRHRIAELEATLAAQTRSLRKSCEELQRERDEATREVERREAELVRSRAEWNGRLREGEAARQGAERLAEARAEALQDRDREIAALQASLDAARAERAGLGPMTETLAALRRENADLAERCTRLTGELEAARSRESVAEDRRRQLESDLSEAARRAGASGRAALRELLARRDAELAAVRAERDRLRDLLERFGRDGTRQGPGEAAGQEGAPGVKSGQPPARKKARRKV